MCAETQRYILSMITLNIILEYVAGQSKLVYYLNR